ncbi:MAG: alcohol dehydrogenase catalytic domain-containing protein [Anaerolineaceae bacterium]|nr:alcohol dehydrogenase catalytic domain-containing protein [Anaerolineaceae bacterium]
MKAAVLYEKRDMRVEQRPKPKPQGSQVLIRVRAVGVCGSDVHYWTEMCIGDQVVKAPQPVGHEFAGQVAEVGPEVRHLKVGQRVCIEPALSCGRCRQCLEGRPNCCPNVIFYGTPPVEGALQEFVLAEAEQCTALPEAMSYAEAAMLEPLQVGIHAFNLLPCVPGDWVVIVGAGSIGLACLAMVHAAGATRIIVTDKLDYRLELAKKLGATQTINVTKEDPQEAANQLTDGLGADLVYEATNTVDGLPQALAVARIGGRVAAIGIPPVDAITIPASHPRRKQLTVQFIRRSAHTLRQALELVATGKVDVKPWITHRFPLDRVTEAFELVDSYADGVLKAVIEM